jgi:hypothetical protein
VRQVSDGFLLQVAEISAGLVGLFLVGVFFYVEARDGQADALVDRYFRASARIVLVIYALPIGLSLSLVVLVPAASRLLLVLLSVALVVANVDSAIHVRTVALRTGSRLLPATELVGTLLVVATVTVPWLLGGFHPTREDLTWSILLAFATGLLSIYAVVLSAFDLRRALS